MIRNGYARQQVQKAATCYRCPVVLNKGVFAWVSVGSRDSVVVCDSCFSGKKVLPIAKEPVPVFETQDMDDFDTKEEPTEEITMLDDVKPRFGRGRPKSNVTGI